MKKTEQTLEETLLRGHDEKIRFTEFWAGIQHITTSYFQQKDHELHTKLLSKHVSNREVTSKGGIFNPDHPMKLLWDLFIGLFILYSVIIIPYRVGFNITPSPRAASFDMFITALFGLDILVTFNTAYVDIHFEILEYRRNKIIQHYLQFWFWIDVLAMFPFDGLANAALDKINISAIRIIRILRLVRLIKLYRLITRDQILEKFHIHPELINLIGLILQIFFIAHVIACFWHYIALPDVSEGYANTWLLQFQYATGDVGSRYIASLYFTFVTMLTIGYGDIRPTNQLERLYAIFTMLVGGLVFGALVQKVALSMNPKSKKQQELMYQMKLFLVEMSIPVELRDKAKASYAYYLSKRTHFDESDSFAKLPYEMLQDLVQKLYAQEIGLIKIFKVMDSAFIVNILSKARPMHFSRDEIILDEGDVCNDFFFLKHGVVRMTRFSGQDHEVVGCVTVGDYFGDCEFKLKSIALTRYTAVKACQMLAVSHAVITEALNHNHDNSSTFSTFLSVRCRELKKVLREKSSRQKQKMKMDQFEILTKELSTEEMLSAPPSEARGILLSSLSSPSRRKSLVRQMSNGAQLIYRDGHRCDLASSLHFLYDIEEEEKNVNRDDHRKQHRVLEVNLTSKDVRFAEWSLQDFRQHGLIYPEGKYKSMWDGFISILIVYSCFVVPVEIAFQENAYQYSSTVNLIISGCFFVDMMLWFRTCFVSNQHEALIVSNVLIIRNYVFGWFFIDLFSMVPIDVFIRFFTSSSSLDNLAFTQMIKILRLLRLARIARVMKLNLFLDKVEETLNISPVIFEIFSISAQVFFIVHLVCCLWWGMAEFAATRDTTIWYESYIRPDDSIASKYLFTIYFTYTTFSTVGYGDILPTSNAERALAIFVVLIGGSIFGYSIAQITTALNSSDNTEGTIKGKINELQDYLTEKKCSPFLSQKILDHYEKKYKSQTSFDLKIINTSLPPKVANEIICCVFAKAMDRISMLKFIENKTVARKIFSLLKVSYYGQDTEVIRGGQECEEMYFLVQGNARAYRSKRLAFIPVTRETRSSSVFNNYDISAKLQQPPNLMKSKPARKKSQSRQTSVSVVNGSSSGDEDDDDIYTMDFEAVIDSKPFSTNGRKTRLQKAYSLTSNSISDLSSSSPSQASQLHRQLSTREPTANSTSISNEENTADGMNEFVADESDNPTTSSTFLQSIKMISPRLFSALMKLYSTAMYTPFKSIINTADPFMNSLSQGVTDQEVPKSMAIEELERCGYKHIGDLIEGDFFGHIAFMTDTKHDCTVRTLTPCTIYILQKSELSNLIRVEPGIAIQLQSALARSIIAQSDSVGNFHVKSVRAKFLKELKEKYFEIHKDDNGDSEDGHDQSSVSNRSSERSSSITTSPRLRKSITQLKRIRRLNVGNLTVNNRDFKNLHVEQLFDDKHVWQSLEPAKNTSGKLKSSKSKLIKVPAFLKPPLKKMKSMRWKGVLPSMKSARSKDMEVLLSDAELLELVGTSSQTDHLKNKKKRKKHLRSNSLSEIDFAAAYSHPSPWSDEKDIKYEDQLLLVTESSLTSGHKSVNFGAKCLPRRQSFPSMDNKLWQETIKHQGLL